MPWSARSQVDRVAVLKPDGQVTPIDLAATSRAASSRSRLGDHWRRGRHRRAFCCSRVALKPRCVCQAAAAPPAYHGVHRRSGWPGLPIHGALPPSQPVYVRLEGIPDERLPRGAYVLAAARLLRRKFHRFTVGIPVASAAPTNREKSKWEPGAKQHHFAHRP